MKLTISLLPMALAVFLSLLGLTAFIYIHQTITKDLLIQIERRHLTEDMLGEHALLEAALMRGDEATLKNWVSTNAESDHIQLLFIIAPDFEIKAANKIALEGENLAYVDHLLFSFLSEQRTLEQVRPIWRHPKNTDQMQMLLPLQFGNKTGWLFAGYDLKATLKTSWQITLQNISVYLISMLTLGSLTYLLLKRVLGRRLHALSTTLRRYSTGEHHARASISKSNEFRALEHMLNNTFDALNAEREIKVRTQQFNELILDSSTDGIISADQHGIILKINHAALQIFGFSNPEELLGQNLNLLIPPQFRHAHQSHLTTNSPMTPQQHQVLNKLRQVEGVRKDGHLVPLDITITRSKLNEQLVFTAFIKDTTEQRQYQQSIEKLAYYDSLTGIPNVHGMQRAINEVSPFRWLYLINIDGMSLLNSSFGFEVGDQYIAAACQLIQHYLKATMLLGRNQGAEFILLSAEDPAAVLPLLHQLQGTPLRPSDFQITCSFCMTYQPWHFQTDFIASLQSAELMMQHAKAAGRGSALPVEPGLISQLQANARLCHQLEQAISAEQLQFYYQPKFNASSRQAASAEALIRWQLDGQWISPAEFIPLAEKSHLMPALDRFVIRQNCRQIRQWLDDGFMVLPISINLSAQYLQDDRLISYIFQNIGEYDVPAQLLEIEVTEYSLIRDSQHTADNMLRLQKAGISIAVDDFGTGHSNLATVLSLPVQNLKIDQSFIRTGMRTTKGKAILENIMQLAKSLQVITTAEGVETEEQLAFLQQSGCQFIQGYLLSKPLPLAEFEQLLHTTSRASSQDSTSMPRIVAL